jgi:tetratricopeptide (TPR) repeat protein
VLSARLIGVKDGATLLAVRETADGAGGLIAAVDKLSKKVREGIGESLRTIRGGEPLEDVTTHSLEALRKYSQAEHAADIGEEPRAIALIKEAIRLDSSFAMAYRKLAALIGNVGGNTSEQAAAVRKAFELRDRLPEREKLLAIAYYYWVLDYNSDKVIEAYRQVLDTWPDDNTAANNLAIELDTRSRYAEAVAVLEPAVAHSPQIGVLHVNLVETLTMMGKFAQADSAMARWAAVQPTSGLRYSTGFRYSFGKGDYDAAMAYADSAALRGNPVIQARGHHQRANVYRIRGQVARADKEEYAEADINRQAGNVNQMMLSAVDLAFGNIMLRGKPEAGEKILDSLVATFAKSGVDPVDLPYLAVSTGYARAGALAKAERFLAEYEQKTPQQLRKSDVQRPYATAQVALAKGQYNAALAGFREYRVRNGGVITGLTEIGQAFEGMRQPDSALAAYEGFANQPDVGPAFRQYALPTTLRHLGEIYEGRNNKDKALEYYGRFVALWKNSDPELQPQVQEVKRRMAALAGEPGRAAVLKP